MSDPDDEESRMFYRLKAADMAGDKTIEIEVALYFLDKWLNSTLKLKDIARQLNNGRWE